MVELYNVDHVTTNGFLKKKIKKETKIISETPKKFIKKKVPEDTEELISEAENAISTKSHKKSKKNRINILNFLIVFIITLEAIIILADTFKNTINLFIPGFDLILNNLYETLKDVMLFFKDLFN